MQYEEFYLVSLTEPDGNVLNERHADVTSANEDYENCARTLGRGEKVELRRHSVVTLALATKAR